MILVLTTGEKTICIRQERANKRQRTLTFIEFFSYMVKLLFLHEKTGVTCLRESIFVNYL